MPYIMTWENADVWTGPVGTAPVGPGELPAAPWEYDRKHDVTFVWPKGGWHEIVMGPNGGDLRADDPNPQVPDVQVVIDHFDLTGVSLLADGSVAPEFTCDTLNYEPAGDGQEE